jgi:hypothetical protein
VTREGVVPGDQQVPVQTARLRDGAGLLMLHERDRPASARARNR